MPKPGYIVCSQSGGLDQYTNAISCFELLEVLQMVKEQPKPAEISKLLTQGNFRDFHFGPIRMRVATTWLREQTDSPQQVYEAHVVLRLPGGEEVIVAKFPPFTISAAIHRLLVPVLMMPFASGPGLLNVECRIRRLGEDNWLATQSYPILLEEPRSLEGNPAEPKPSDAPSPAEPS